MKNSYSIKQRNEIVEAHLWCIEATMEKHASLIRAARMDEEDVYQQLALRLIKAVAGHDPEIGPLVDEIMLQLGREVFRCKSPRRMFGLTEAPKGFHKDHVVSFDAICEAARVTDQALAA